MWRKRLLMALAVAGGVAAAFVVGELHGRRSAPAQVETRDRVVYQDRVIEKRVEVAAKVETAQTRRHMVRTRVTRPDGTREERTELHVGADTTKAEQTTHVDAREETRHVTRDTEVVVEHVRNDWTVSTLVGADASLVLRGELRPIFGGLVQRRVLGPVSVGAWGLSSGAGGVSLSLEF